MFSTTLLFLLPLFCCVFITFHFSYVLNHERFIKHDNKKKQQYTEPGICYPFMSGLQQMSDENERVV